MTCKSHLQVLEGLAFNHQQQILYVAQERDPIKLLSFKLQPNGQLSRLPADLEGDELPVPDLSGLHYDGKSGQSRLLLGATASGGVVSHINLWSGSTNILPQGSTKRQLLRV